MTSGGKLASSWGKETIGNRLTPPGQGSLGTQSYASLEEMNKTTRGNVCRGAEEENRRRKGVISAKMAACDISPPRNLHWENKSKVIQANKTLEVRDRVLTVAIRRCHIELAKKKSLRDVEARKNEVEVAWREYMQAISRYCMYAGREEFYETKVAGGLYTHPLAGHFGYFGKEIDEQPEEARRAWYECKVLTDMVEEVVDKAEEFLESATKENSCGEHKDD